ncbi:MAG: hypothetical protein ACYC3X_29375 [Pirellulaceae bacterium]
MEALVSTIICFAPAIALAMVFVILEELKMSKPQDRSVPATCQRCGAVYEQNQACWAVHKVTGKRAGGFNGQQWYDNAGAWREGEYTVVWDNVYSCGGPYDVCETCQETCLRAKERAREYESPCEPDWFDPSYAGERWDDDY